MARPKSDPKKRFLEKVRQMENGCHEWQAVLHRDGYGKFYYNGKQVQAHRVAYDLFVGDIQDKWVLHKCDNRKCVNPSHLFLGTCKDNIQGRGTKAKLTEDQVNKVNELLAQRYSQQEIADMFGVHQTLVSRIKRKATTHFKH